jgi:hypothetical protein
LKARRCGLFLLWRIKPNIEEKQQAHIITHISQLRCRVMGQVTIYLDDEIEKKMVAAAKSSHLSKSKWISKVIQEKVANEWPQSIVDLAGAWGDFPDINDIRSKQPNDAKRESL